MPGADAEWKARGFGAGTSYRDRYKISLFEPGSQTDMRNAEPVKSCGSGGGRIGPSTRPAGYPDRNGPYLFRWRHAHADDDRHPCHLPPGRGRRNGVRTDQPPAGRRAGMEPDQDSGTSPRTCRMPELPCRGPLPGAAAGSEDIFPTIFSMAYPITSRPTSCRLPHSATSLSRPDFT